MSKKWTTAELLTLGDMYRDGMTSKQIGEKLGRTARGVEHAIARYRNVINVPYRKPREVSEPVVEPKKPWWKFW